MITPPARNKTQQEPVQEQEELFFLNLQGAVFHCQNQVRGKPCESKLFTKPRPILYPNRYRCSSCGAVYEGER